MNTDTLESGSRLLLRLIDADAVDLAPATLAELTLISRLREILHVPAGNKSTHPTTNNTE